SAASKVMTPVPIEANLISANVGKATSEAAGMIAVTSTSASTTFILLTIASVNGSGATSSPPTVGASITKVETGANSCTFPSFVFSTVVKSSVLNCLPCTTSTLVDNPASTYCLFTMELAAAGATSIV